MACCRHINCSAALLFSIPSQHLGTGMMQSRLPSKQRGVTALGWMVILALIGFFVLLGLKIIPIYMDHYRIKAVMESLTNEPLLIERGPPQIRQLIERRLKINYVWGFDKNNVKIVKNNSGYNVRTKFESRENLFGNLDVVVRFDHAVTLTR